MMYDSYMSSEANMRPVARAHFDKSKTANFSGETICVVCIRETQTACFRNGGSGDDDSGSAAEPRGPHPPSLLQSLFQFLRPF